MKPTNSWMLEARLASLAHKSARGFYAEFIWFISGVPSRTCNTAQLDSVLLRLAELPAASSRARP